MRHYEVVFLIHPDQSDKATETIDRHKALVEEKGGKIHRVEDWGRRQLAYSIDNAFKAHYVLMNIECNQAALDALENNFKFNDAIIRKVIISRKTAITTPSAFSVAAQQANTKKRSDDPIMKVVSYDNIFLLKRFIMESGRIIPARLTNTTAKMQRQVAHAIKLARTLALLPYCDRH